ncbi:MAG TPA: CheR family methyltransferase [Kofleriaceae bacterium]
MVGAGEPDSAEQLLRDLPAKLGCAVVASSPLTLDAVRAASRLPVVSVKDRARVEHDHVYVVPNDRDVRLEQGHLIVGSDGRSQPRLDAMLRSIAGEVGAASVAVVLAGRGGHGALGVQRIKEAGGWTMAQDITGEDGEMPRAAIATGRVDLVLPIDQLALRLAHSAGSEDSEVAPGDPRTDGGDTLRDILALIRTRSGHDFSSYKRGTLHRRIARRMQVRGCDAIATYSLCLRDDPDELLHLVRDFLIGATQFFRDPASFEAVARDVIPRLFDGKEASDSLRIWVAGCATGGEAYSLAMLVLEHAEQRRRTPQIQIFASDIDRAALEIARLGCYPETIAGDVTPERLQRFFRRDGGQYRVCKELRDLMLFSAHNLLRDPPFARLDLISCRNVLLYLDREARNRVLTMFHFGLLPERFLVLGASESTEGSPMFAAVDARHSVFTRRTVPASLADAIASANHWQSHAPDLRGAERSRSIADIHRRLIEQHAPASLLVNAELDVLRLSDHASRYLQLSAGEPSRELLRLVHPALRSEVHAAVQAARHTGTEARLVSVADRDRSRTIEIRVHAVDVPELGRGAMLVMFSEREGALAFGPEASSRSPIEPAVREIVDELHETQDQLRATIDEHETAVEELKASNEELRTINEALQTAGQDLETSKEELESANQELVSVNQELARKMHELARIDSDLQNLMTSTDIGVVFLDRDLRVERFTPRAQELFHILATDVGRPLDHLTHRLDCPELWDIAQSVLETLHAVERELRSRDGRSFLVRWLPYRTIADRIEGLVLTFVDVSDLRDAVSARERSEQARQQAEARLRVALRSAPRAVLGFDAVVGAADAMVVTWGFVLGHELGSHERADLAMFAPGHGERLRACAGQVVTQRTGQRVELDVVLGGAQRTFDFRIEPTAFGATAVGFDITPSEAADHDDPPARSALRFGA